MVLNNNFAKVTPKGIYSDYKDYNFIVLNAESIKYGDDKVIFEYNIEVLNLIREVNEINRFCENLKSNFKINTSIFYKIIDCLMTKRQFTDSEIEEYFNTTIQFEKFIKASSQLIDTCNILCLPTEVEYIILGLKKLFSEQQKNDISDSYGDLICKLRFDKMETKDFIKKAKELICSTEQKVLN